MSVVSTGHFRRVSESDKYELKTPETTVAIDGDLISDRLKALRQSCRSVSSRLQELSNRIHNQTKKLEDCPRNEVFRWWNLQKYEANQMIKWHFIQGKLQQYMELYQAYQQLDPLRVQLDDMEKVAGKWKFNRLDRLIEQYDQNHDGTVRKEYVSLKSISSTIGRRRHQLELDIAAIYYALLQYHYAFDKISYGVGVATVCNNKVFVYQHPFHKHIDCNRVESPATFSSERHPHLQKQLNQFSAPESPLPKVNPFLIEIPPDLSQLFRARLEPFVEQLLDKQREIAKSWISNPAKRNICWTD